ncbi:response regulator transcription factor [Streptomyces sp. NPDC001941]|uniref:response regulator transcription factor n=1 Tax=Streptomyces sp. NPDC001941 TaxID=3154659 RepID=UPI003333C803
MTVLIADDQELIRSGLRAVIDAEGDLVVVGQAGDGAEAVSAARTLAPDVVLMDLNMPKVGGVDATKQIMRGERPPKVLVLTTLSSDDHVLEALDAGASGFLLKDSLTRELTAAIRTVAAGGTALSPEVMGGLVTKARGHRGAVAEGADRRLSSLTSSEGEVLRLLGRGLTNQQIADELHLSVTSVKTYVSRLLARLGLDNRTQAAILAYESGLLDG